MEDIEFSCISCRSSLSASKSDVGELVQCPTCNHTMKVPRYGVVAGMKLGDFKVLKCLGVGGMGEVWLAEQESLQRKVALKILSPDISNDESFINRFNQEVRIAGKLIHPNIVVAFQAGEQNGIRYLTCAYIDGLVASEEIEMNGPIDEANVLRIGRDVAKGLKYAWEKAHILHRDVKPDNIMLAKDGTPMLMDMGISKNFDEDVSLTMTGEIIGTPNYISPEQAHAADDIDFRSDQYSLGATLFHLLTGMLPYRATSAMGILSQHLHDPVPDAREYNLDVSETCSKMIQKMMSKKAEDRYQSWDEFIVSANALLPPEMRDGTMLPGAVTVPKTSNNKTAVLIGTLTAVIVVCILVGSIIIGQWINRKPRNEKQISKVPSDFSAQVPTVTEIETENTKIKQNPQATEKTVPEIMMPDKIELKNPDRNIDPKHEAAAAFFKSKWTKRIQEKFEVSESGAKKLAEKLFNIHLKKREIAITTSSPAEHRIKFKEELEPLRTDLKNTVIEILGKNRWPKFEQFMKNEMSGDRRPRKGFGGGRRR